MTQSAFLVVLRNSAQKANRQGANRAAQQAHRPVQNQTQRAVSTEAATNKNKGPPPKNTPITDEEAYEFLVLDVSLGRL